MHLLVKRFLVGALDAVADRRPGGPIAITSPGDASYVIIGLAFLL